MKNKFFEAIITEDVRKIKLLLKIVRINPSINNNYAIRLTSENGHLEVVELLLSDPRVDPTVNNNEAIRSASVNGHLEVVGLLLSDSRVDPSDNNNYAIQRASRCGQAEVVKLLLSDPRVDPTVNNNGAIRWASINGNVGVVNLLLNDDRVDPTADNNYAIQWASSCSHLKVVNLLLNDARVDWRYVDNKDQMVKNNENQLKSELTTSYLSIERSSPQTTISGVQKSKLPKEIIRQIVYMGLYQGICEIIHNSEIPPIKLVALTKILKVEYDDKILWSKLYNKVKQAICVYYFGKY